MWEDEDAAGINSAIFGDGDVYKYMDNLPRVGWARQAYDRVEKDGDLVGISHSHSRSFEWDVRGIVSLYRIDVEHSEPGTEITIIWCEPGGTSPNPKIADHVQTEIEATVQPAPYTTDKRRSN